MAPFYAAIWSLFTLRLTLWIKEALEAQTTLVLLPSLSLLSQTMREWAWAGNTDFDILNVCSDKSVGKKTEDMDPADAPFPVTSEVQEIAKFLKQPKPKVVFCTYQSSDLIAQAQLDDAVPTFDLAVADEAHRCAGKADAGFATILDADKIRASKRLFTTATPRYFGKAIKDEAKARDLAVVGMDNEAVFGPVIHKLTFGQAIEQELLTDYQVVIVGVDEPMIREWIENYEIVSTDPDNQTDARTLAAKIGMLKAVKDYDLKRVISFHSRVAGAKQFSDELVDVANLIEPTNRPEGTFLSDYVSGAMKAGDRKEKIDRLKELEGYDRGILTNARCLAEGVDVPSLDGVAFIDPKGSQVEIIQAVGRAIRKVRGAAVQKKGTIVLPVFIEDGDDHETSIEASNFKPVWDVLKALRSHDDDMANTLDQYRTNMAKNASQNRERISDKIIFDMPVSVDAKFSSALRTVLVEASTASWEFLFGLLERFKEAEGHCRVHPKYELDGFKLGVWVGVQRRTKNFMSPERRQRLEDIGFIWDPHGEDWEEGFSKLLHYKEAEGHCRVPDNFQLDGFRLGYWVKRQRTGKDKLSPERRQRLEDIGFIWDSLDEDWEEGFSKILQFRKANGHCKVPGSFKLNGFNLGSWVRNQRTIKDRMSPERKQRLEDIGFIWDSLAEDWEAGFSKLLHYKEAEGHCRVPDNFQLDGFRLGYWVKRQRTGKDKLSPERRQRLEDIGFIWDPHEEDFIFGLSKCNEYFLQNGHLNPTVNSQNAEKMPCGFKIGQWVSLQRGQKNKLLKSRPDRYQALVDTPGWQWTGKVDVWHEKYSILIDYISTYGHASPKPKDVHKGVKIGGWVREQRLSRKRQKLFKEREELLEKLPGWSWDPHEDAWEKGFAALLSFKKIYGHCDVKQGYVLDEFKLGSWIRNQKFRPDDVPQNRKQRLDDIGFIWGAPKDKT